MPLGSRGICIAVSFWFCVLSIVQAQAGQSGDPRPRQWCGWHMRQVMGVADTSFNLAHNWAHYGHAAFGPGIGVVAVWGHHVGIIRGGPDSSGQWLVESGNDGHGVRTRYRSLRGVIAFRS